MSMPSCLCIPPDGDRWNGKWLRVCDYHKRQQRNLDLARGALADIANSADMTLEIARNKALRIYRETEPTYI